MSVLSLCLLVSAMPADPLVVTSTEDGRSIEASLVVSAEDAAFLEGEQIDSRAARMAFLSAGLSAGSKRLVPPTWQACITALRCWLASFEPATNAATFCSSTDFQLMNCSMSG